MAGINKAILIGNVGTDPIVRTFDNNVKVMNFRMATTESYRDREGNWQEQTEWHNIVGYRYLAEKNIAKGDMVYVEGKIKNRKYTDREGIEKYITEIIADKINILNRRDQNGSQQADSRQEDTMEETGDNASSTNKAEKKVEDDLPF